MSWEMESAKHRGVEPDSHYELQDKDFTTSTKILNFYFLHLGTQSCTV